MSVATLDLRLLELVSSKADRIERQSLLPFGLTTIVRSHVAGAVNGVLMLVVRRALRKGIAQNTDMAVWFKGAASRVRERERDRELDADDASRAKLKALQEHFLALRADTQRFLADINAFGKFAPEVERLLRSWSESAAELHEAVEDLIGSIQAHDADYWSAQLGGGTPMTEHGAIEELLSKACSDK